MDYLDSFGDWLRQRREALCLTRPELAECVGCSVSALRKIEADERRPSRQLAELLADCLRIPAEEQLLFLDAARGVQLVARLGHPTPGATAVPSGRLPSSPVAAKTREAGPAWNLPFPATPLLGRETELATIVQLLSQPDCRLLSLVGPGGIGKTRLAIEAACYLWERFGAGVCFAPLATTDSPEFMVPAIAQAVGLNFSGPAEPRTQLVNYLRNKELLLLLDNLEHLLQGIDVLVELLASTRYVKLLVTSRERMQLSGEWVFEVQGLPVPAEGQVEGLQKVSAVRLFLQRARQASSDFELNLAGCTDVVRICRLVEGMPLALELAAAWVPVLSCQEIADEIERGLDILSTRLRDIPERQRSLQAVFDHSWALLDAEEQQTLAQLSVFQSGFEREAAEAVAAASLPLLSSLVTKSFLRRTSRGRYSLHELVRQYVAGRLAETAEEEVQARDRHSTFYISFVSQLGRELKGADQLQALGALDADADNIRAAWRWAVRRRKLPAIRKTARALWYFYEMHNWYREAEVAYSWAVSELSTGAEPDGEPDRAIGALQAYLQTLQGWFHLRRGNLEKAQSLLQSSLGALRLPGTSVELADALYYAGVVSWLSGDYAVAQALFSEELAVAEQVGDDWDISLATGSLGLVAQALGEYEEAQKRFEAGLAINRRLGEQRMVGVALHFLGTLKRTIGAYEEARACLRECLEVSRLVNERWTYAMALSELGAVMHAMGNPVEAIRLLNESLTLLRELGEPWSILHALNNLGAASLATGAYAESRAAYSEALAMAWERQTLPEVLEAALGMAKWAARQGALDRALVATIFVLNQSIAAEQTKVAARELRAKLEPQLTAEQIEAAKGEAGALCLEDLVTDLSWPSFGSP